MVLNHHKKVGGILLDWMIFLDMQSLAVEHLSQSNFSYLITLSLPTKLLMFGTFLVLKIFADHVFLIL